MRATLRAYWGRRHSYQSFLYACAALLLASGVVHVGVFLVDGGSWEGPISWRKPVTFGFSMGVTVLAVAWILTFLPRRPVGGWILSGILGTSAVAEVFLITMQQWRGVPSHFNVQHGFDAAVFAAMGVFVGLIALSVAVVAVGSFLSLDAPPSLAWAIRLGLVLLVLSQGLGGLIIENGNTNIDDPTGLGQNATFGAAGAMKVPHALTLHAVQLLPLLAWLMLFIDWEERRRTRFVLMAALGYAGITAVSIIQTFSGRAPFVMTLVVAALFWASILLMVGVIAAIGIALLRSRTIGPPAAASSI